jgi:hypothetical protein
MTDLSPAAQAVLDAYGKYPLHGNHIAETLIHGALPAALRAAADQLTPYTVSDMDGAAFARNKLLAIADELEAQ